ncbi:hypothetical protein HIM_00869 [Hirsutella minnesotensis 3608]|nr:hypothetical protein HIM_00869 [Hirsutella minnesotensis 3608]
MSFRRRNVIVQASTQSPAQQADKVCGPGIRPSPLDGRPTTSTGTASLDQLLAGHCGLPLGTSLLIEEAGATDFGGILLRYFAAEGLVQGHQVHVLANVEDFRRELPGLAVGSGSVGSTPDRKSEPVSPGKMRIAWRYEALGNASNSFKDKSPNSALVEDSEPFCHTFSMTRRLEASAIRGHLHGLRSSETRVETSQAPLKSFLDEVASRVAHASPLQIHRVLIPNLLSPTVYNPLACQPGEVLQFLHGLRSLLRLYPTQITVLLTLPVSLHRRGAGLTRWMELLSDGVVELVSLPHKNHLTQSSDRASSFQGLLRVHSLPIFHERGGGIAEECLREEQSFKLSASSGMIILPYSLPPMGEDDNSSQPTPSQQMAPPAATLEF